MEGVNSRSPGRRMSPGHSAAWEHDVERDRSIHLLIFSLFFHPFTICHASNICWLFGIFCYCDLLRQLVAQI